ncbi:recombinase family protein [Streptomyces sp. NPDC102476]|uniref:recombinase family protein n=1 Tax=Streptomyces sp. NPDC102476 TaxID=3366181 RepID=UPI00381DC3DC
MLPGYCRTSTADQNPDHQIDALLRNGVDRDNIHVDVASGAKASRPKLDLVMQLMREGDTLKVTRLDRLSRSVLHLVTLGADLRERGIGLHVIEQGIDTSTMEGRAMFEMLKAAGATRVGDDGRAVRLRARSCCAAGLAPCGGGAVPQQLHRPGHLLAARDYVSRRPVSRSRRLMEWSGPWASPSRDS